MSGDGFRPRMRPPESYVHGVEAGGCVLVPARVAAWLERAAGLRELRTRSRGKDAEVDAVLVALATAGAAWRTSATGSAVAAPAEARPDSDSMPATVSTPQAADLLGLTQRAVRLAIQRGALEAEQVGGRWEISREAVEHYRRARGAA